MKTNLNCSFNKTIVEILNIFNLNGKGIVFCIDDQGKFQGTISEGDIRRAIIAGLPLDLKIKILLDKNSDEFNRICTNLQNFEVIDKIKKPSVFASINTPLPDLIKLINDRIKIIPLLDENERVVDYFEYNTRINIPIASSIIYGEEYSNVLECLDTNWISSQGRFVTLFEKKFAEFNNSKYAVTVMNGTAALSLALMALGIKKGDEVILPNLTFAASINAILFIGAKPVIVDIIEKDFGLNPKQVLSSITKKTKAIMPVHLYGYCCDMEAIKKIAHDQNIYIVEDAAESIGAKYKDKFVGALGEIGCFSFFGNKIITTGEGGMCTTDDEGLFNKMLQLRDHGMSKTKKYWHDVVGYNFRMTNLQAAIGCGQLNRIESLLLKRMKILNLYKQHLNLEYFKFIEEPTNRNSVVWLVSCLLKKLDVAKFVSIAKDKYNIDIRKFFYPLNKMPIYKKYCKTDVSESIKISNVGVNLPTLLNLSDMEYINICNNLNLIAEKVKIN